MARQEINLGAMPNGQGGDPPRVASQKINYMTQELYDKHAALGTAASRNVQTSVVDADPSKLMVVGSFGRGLTVAPELPNLNADVAVAAGNYCAGAEWVGSPFPGRDGRNQGYLTVEAWYNTNYMSQTFRSLNSKDGFFERRANGGVWGAWVPVVTPLTAVGTVNTTQTGAIIERGQNANGNYIRFVDGTMMTWGLQVINTNCPPGQAVTWDETLQPKPFVGTPIHHVEIAHFSQPDGGGQAIYTVMQNYGRLGYAGFYSAALNTGQTPNVSHPSFVLGELTSRSYAVFYQSSGRWM